MLICHLKFKPVMIKGMLHLHHTVVIIFLISFAIKSFLLLTNKNEALEKARNKTKILEMILGVLILGTGFYLLSVLPAVETYLITKIVLVLAGIPLGIIGLKKGNKILTVIALLLFIYVYVIGKTRSLTFTREKANIEVKSDDQLVKGKAIYETMCKQCHGDDGKLGVAGAKDLTISKLTPEEKIEIINKGKGLMRGFKNELTEEQIKDVAAYVESLKTK